MFAYMLCDDERNRKSEERLIRFCDCWLCAFAQQALSLINLSKSVEIADRTTMITAQSSASCQLRRKGFMKAFDLSSILLAYTGLP